MSALAVEHEAINLGQGFPEHSGPASIVEAAAEAMRAGRNQYQPGRGIPELRAAIARHQDRHWGIALDPATDIVVTTGATEAIAASILGLVDPGDEVILFEPFYDSYRAMVQMAGGVVVPVPLTRPGFRPDLEALAAAVTPRTRLLMVNSPHNPSGMVFTADELGAIARVAVDHDLVVLSDEVYEHLVFDDARHRPMATLPGMFERTLTLSSAGKTFSFTGWKIGWASGPAELVGATLAAKQFLTYTSGAPFQPAIAAALLDADEVIAELRRELVARRDQLFMGLTGLGFEATLPQAGYFIVTDIRPLGFTDGEDFCARMPAEAGVAAVPCQALFDDVEAGRPYVRWAFCKSEAAIEEAVARLRVWLA